MLDFHPVTIEDKQWVQPLLDAEHIPLCDYSFVSFFCWQHVYEQEICQFENRLLVHAKTAIGSAYLWPVGQGDPVPALKALEADAERRGEPLRFVGVLEEHLPVLESLFGKEEMEIIDTPDTYDYFYEIDRLADLPGKKLHAKRNHINRFRQNCPSGDFKPLTPADIPDCLELDRRWYEEHLEMSGGVRDEGMYMERAAMVTALNYFEALGMHGGVLRCNGELLAFTLGGLLTPTIFDVNFERAMADFQGAFPMINQEFAQWIRENYPQVKYIDREEDAGSPGLRKAKQSYYPDWMGKNVCVVFAQRKERES